MIVDTPWGQFVEPLDWRCYLRDVFAGKQSLPIFDRNPNHDYCGDDCLLGVLGEKLDGTSALGRYADAALGLIETGTPGEARAARSCPYQRAPRSKERLLRLLEQHRDRVEACGLVWTLLGSLLALDPEAPRSVGVLIAIASNNVRDPDLQTLAAWYAPDWFIEHIPPLDADTWVMRWIRAVPDSHRGDLLTALVAAGPGYLDRALEPLRDPRTTELTRSEMEAAIRSNPTFARALEGLKGGL